MTEIITASQAVTVAKTTTILDLPDSMAPLFDELANVSFVRQEADKREKEIKALIYANLPEQPKNVKFVLRVASVIRASVTKGSKTTIKADDLMAGWPEAYEACKRVSEYPILNKA